MNRLLAEILELPVPERIKLVQDIWDSIASEPDAIELTEEQKAELDRRIEDYRKNPSETIAWEVIKEELRQRSVTDNKERTTPSAEAAATPPL